MPIYNSEQEIEELQAALEAKAAVNHQHLSTAWQNLSLSTGWSNYGIGYTVPQCRKFIGDLIEIKGVQDLRNWHSAIAFV